MSCSLGLFAFSARADEVYTFVVKKQEEKAKYSYWLTDWLDKRDKIRLMDLWFALHSPSPYEFFIGGAYVGGDALPGIGGYSGMDLNFAAFTSIFGLEGHRDSAYGIRSTGLFDFRIFGYHDQGTNITLQGGLRQIELDDSIGGGSTRNAILGARITLYFARAFGLNGLYRHFYESTPNPSGFTVSGSRLEGGAFIDFSFFRVYGNYFSEPEVQTFGGVSREISKTGFEAGARIYF